MAVLSFGISEVHLFSFDFLAATCFNRCESHLEQMTAGFYLFAVLPARERYPEAFVAAGYD